MAPDLGALWQEAQAEQNGAASRRRTRRKSAGPGAGPTLVEQLDEWERYVQRRRFLAFTGIASSALLARLLPADQLARLVGVLDDSVRVDLETVASLRAVTAGYERLYHGTQPSVLMRPLAEHLQVLRRLLKGAGDTPVRQQLVLAVGEASLIAGWLAFYDFGDRSAARRYLDIAASASEEAGDAPMQCCALGERSSLSAFEHHPRQALEWSQLAISRAAGVSPRLRAWLAATEAEAHAKLRDANSAVRALAEADRHIAEVSPTDRDGWIGYFDASRVEARRGSCYLWLGWPDTAQDVLNDALGQLDPCASKRKGVLLADLANAHLKGKTPDTSEGCRVANDSIELLAPHRHAVGTQRLKFVQSQLRRTRSTPRTVAVQERIDDLAAAV